MLNGSINHGHNTALFIAATTGDINQIKKLLEVDALINQKIDPNGKTALHLALEYQQTAVALELIHRGATSNAKDNWGRTPLHYAAMRGVSEVIEPLLAKGADVNAIDQNGTTALHVAFDFQNFHKKKTFHSQAKDENTQSHLQSTMAFELINRGAQNIKNNEGDTPLDRAQHNGFFDELLTMQKQQLLFALSGLKSLHHAHESENTLPELPDEILYSILMHCLPAIFSRDQCRMLIDDVFTLYSTEREKIHTNLTQQNDELPSTEKTEKSVAPTVKTRARPTELEKLTLWGWDKANSIKRQKTTEHADEVVCHTTNRAKRRGSF